MWRRRSVKIAITAGTGMTTMIAMGRIAGLTMMTIADRGLDKLM